MVGSFQTGEIDMADVLEFDKVGAGGTSSAGAILMRIPNSWKKLKWDLKKVI